MLFVNSTEILCLRYLLVFARQISEGRMSVCGRKRTLHGFWGIDGGTFRHHGPERCPVTPETSSTRP